MSRQSKAVSRKRLEFQSDIFREAIRVPRQVARVSRARSEYTARLLMDRGADANTADKEGQTPLHKASRAGSESTARLLTDRGADANAADQEGRTPLREATLVSSDRIICLLVHFGAIGEATDHEVEKSFPQLFSSRRLLSQPKPSICFWKIRWEGLKTYKECNGMQWNAR